MKYTFEITISGCATNCGHCYVNGGPGPIMPYEDYVLCLQKLAPALDKLGGDVCITLGNEMFCHPRLADIFRHTDEVCPRFFEHKGDDIPTTGVALLRHRDREAILKELQRKGTDQVCFALHGGEADHDRMVQRAGRFGQLFECADFLTGQGFRLIFSLMLSRALLPGLEDVMERIRRYPGARVYPIVPLYCPTPRLRRYQQHRLERQELLALCDRLDVWGVNTQRVRHLCSRCSEQAIWASPGDLAAEFKAAPDWAFFHVTRALKLYYGNVGMHTRYLGDLHQMSSEEVFQAIAPLGPNYDFDAFFPMEAFERLLEMPRPKTDRVYPSRPDCYYAWLDELGTPNLLME